MYSCAGAFVGVVCFVGVNAMREIPIAYGVMIDYRLQHFAYNAALYAFVTQAAELGIEVAGLNFFRALVNCGFETCEAKLEIRERGVEFQRIKSGYHPQRLGTILDFPCLWP